MAVNYTMVERNEHILNMPPIVLFLPQGDTVETSQQ